MNEVQLYISGQRVELFKDETISITDSIQNVRDISKIFTAFSKEFNLPATKETNKLFKHFYNFDITNGFDARFKIEALIKLNGTDFRKGKIRLNSVILKDNVAYSYKVVFFGETVTLSDLLGDAELKSLGNELNAFNQSYSAANTLEGLTKGWTLTLGALVLNGSGDTVTGDLIYPFVSAGKAYFYDTNIPLATANNLHIASPGTYVTGNKKALHYIDLKPAIKAYQIIKAIERKYSITFSEDFFSTANPDFYELFLWLHREKGDLAKLIDVTTFEIKLNEWNLTAPDVELRTDINTTLISSFENDEHKIDMDYIVTVNPTGSGLYDIIIIDDSTGVVLANRLGLTGNQTKAFMFTGSDSIRHRPRLRISTAAGITQFNTSLKIERRDDLSGVYTILDTANYTFNAGANILLSTGLNIGNIMPKMKVIDFLTSLFKLFNLTAFVKDGIIVVKTLDSFYNEGVNHDITQYVDVQNSTVTRGNIFSKIDFRFKEPKTLLAIKSNELNNFEFGNLKFEDATKTFDGGSYEVGIGFEKMVFERMINGATKANILYQWGYFVDKDQQPTIGEPLLFYAQKQTPVETAYFDNGVSYNSFTKYMKPANTRGLNLQSLNFGTETDEFNLNTNTESLFANFYNTYINGIFDVKARMFNVSANLPLSILLNYNLSDRFVIAGKKYKINSINTNLQTGKSELELINEI